MYEIRDRWDANVLPLETHQTKGEAKKALGQWMNPDDKIAEDKTGSLFILAPDYEPTDIFALFVPSPEPEKEEEAFCPECGNPCGESGDCGPCSQAAGEFEERAYGRD